MSLDTSDKAIKEHFGVFIAGFVGGFVLTVLLVLALISVLSRVGGLKVEDKGYSTRQGYGEGMIKTKQVLLENEEIDAEILDLVNALNLGGVRTVGSCSGHGKEHGYIILKDERTLIILPAPLDKDYITRELQFHQSIKLKRRRDVTADRQ